MISAFRCHSYVWLSMCIGILMRRLHPPDDSSPHSNACNSLLTQSGCNECWQVSHSITYRSNVAPCRRARILPAAKRGHWTNYDGSLPLAQAWTWKVCSCRSPKQLNHPHTLACHLQTPLCSDLPGYHARGLPPSIRHYLPAPSPGLYLHCMETVRKSLIAILFSA